MAEAMPGSGCAACCSAAKLDYRIGALPTNRRTLRSDLPALVSTYCTEVSRTNGCGQTFGIVCFVVSSARRFDIDAPDPSLVQARSAPLNVTTPFKAPA